MSDCFSRSAPHLGFTQDGVDFYDQTRSWPPNITMMWRESIVARLGNAANILDLGVGTGRLAIELRREAPNVVGLDFSFPMLSRFSRKQREIKDKVPLIQGDATMLPFHESSFDCVLTTHLWPFVAEWHRGLSEVCRVLRRSGLLIDTEGGPTFEGLRGELHDAWQRALVRRGVVARYPGPQSRHAFEKALRELCARKVGHISIATWSESKQVKELLSTVAGHYQFCFCVPLSEVKAIQKEI